MNSLDTRLTKLEQKQAQDEPIQWKIDVGERGEHGEIIVVNSYLYPPVKRTANEC